MEPTSPNENNMYAKKQSSTPQTLKPKYSDHFHDSKLPAILLILLNTNICLPRNGREATLPFQFGNKALTWCLAKKKDTKKNKKTAHKNRRTDTDKNQFTMVTWNLNNNNIAVLQSVHLTHYLNQSLPQGANLPAHTLEKHCQMILCWSPSFNQSQNHTVFNHFSKKCQCLKYPNWE